MKRSGGEGGWDEAVSPDAVEMLRDVVLRVTQKDPVCGKWSVPSEGECRVWCDASSVALGACVEIDGEVVEDLASRRRWGLDNATGPCLFNIRYAFVPLFLVPAPLPCYYALSYISQSHLVTPIFHPATPLQRRQRGKARSFRVHARHSRQTSSPVP